MFLNHQNLRNKYSLLFQDRHIKESNCFNVLTKPVIDPVTFEQVLANNDAAFQCNFLFNIFFILWMLSVLIELYERIPIDFT